MNELFNALLDTSKLDAGVLKPELSDFPIDRLLTRMDSTFAGAAREKNLSFRVVSSSAFVRSDAILLERIMLNLVSNAVRYTAYGGVVVGCRRRAGMLRIEVCDSGPGIPENQRRNIFAEFYQLATSKRHRTGGLGLGLSIVDRLCRLLGHPIELTSVLRRGSRFAVLVPLAAAQAEMVVTPPTVPQPIRDVTSGKLVVVIDDDQLVLEGMGGMLRSWGCRVVAAGTLDTARSGLAGYSHPPDLIISDYRLSDGHTGIDVIEQLRKAYPTPIPAFLITGDSAPERLREAQATGHHLLHKPVPPIKLRAMLNQLLKIQRVAEPMS